MIANVGGLIMRVLVCGSRDWVDEKSITNELDKLPLDTVIIEGGARGADSIAQRYARSKGFQVETYKADWGKYNKAAGPIRNQQMLETGVDLVIAFQLNNSRGTKDMINRSKMVGVEAKIIKA